MRVPVQVDASMSAAANATEARIARLFWGLWSLLLGLRVLLATQLPLFGDEAFYAWESRHPAWAYSDLPGFTAASIAVGRVLIESELGIRLVSLVLGALLPLQLLRIADAAGLNALRWRVGLLGLLLPLLSLNGVLALPEPALLMAAAFCLHALLRLQALGSGVRWKRALWPWAELLLGLALGALTHYRFLAVLAPAVWPCCACPRRGCCCAMSACGWSGCWACAPGCRCCCSMPAANRRDGGSSSSSVIPGPSSQRRSRCRSNRH